MRKKLFTALLLLVVFIASAQEQVPDAKKFYIKGGYSLHGKNYYGLNDSKDPKTYDNWWKDLNMKGGNLELGSLFNIDQIKLGDKFAVGIDVNYLTTNFMLRTNNNSSKSDEKNYEFSVGSAVGPVVTFNASKSIAFDLYFKVNPIWITGSIYTEENFTEGYLGFEGMKYKMGLNVRLDFFVISAEFNPGSVIMQDYDFTGDYFGNLGELSDDVLKPSELSKKTPLPVFNFNIGFCF